MHCHVWTAPLVKGVLRLCERLGCGLVFGLFALGRDPLALMIGPLGSLPQSPYRTRLGADSASGFRALSVGSHHPLVTLDCVSPESRDTRRGMLSTTSAFFKRRSAVRCIRRRASSTRRRCARPCWPVRQLSA